MVPISSSSSTTSTSVTRKYFGEVPTSYNSNSNSSSVAEAAQDLNNWIIFSEVSPLRIPCLTHAAVSARIWRTIISVISGRIQPNAQASLISGRSTPIAEEREEENLTSWNWPVEV